MRKSRILGCALTLAATLMVGGAMGQLPTTNYVEIKSATPGDENEFSLVQVNKTYGFYVKPDAAYHTSYDKDGTLTNGFSWNWSILPATTTPSATAAAPHKVVADGSSKSIANYAAFLFKENKEYTITVTEKAPDVWGITCVNPVSFKVYAFPAPSFTALKSTDGSVVAANGDAFKKFCASDDGNATVKFSLASSGTPHVNYKVLKAAGSILADGTIEAKDADFTDFAVPSDSKTFTGTQWTWDADPTKIPATPAMVTTNAKDIDAQATMKTALNKTTNSLATYELGVQFRFPKPVEGDKAITVYRVMLLSSNGLISRKGDYNADGTKGTELFYDAKGVEYAAATASTEYVDFYVIKAPKTGPVYHIGNNVAK